MLKKCTLHLQNLSKTWWSACLDVCWALNENRQGNPDSLYKVANDDDEKPSTRNVANTLKSKLSSLVSWSLELTIHGHFMESFISVIYNPYWKVSIRLTKTTVWIHWARNNYNLLWVLLWLFSGSEKQCWVCIPRILSLFW